MFKKTIVTLIVLIALLLVFIAFMNGPMPMPEQQTESSDASKQERVDRHKQAREQRQIERQQEVNLLAKKLARAERFAECMGTKIYTNEIRILSEGHVPTVINGIKVPMKCMDERERETVIFARRVAKALAGEHDTESEKETVQTPPGPSGRVLESAPVDMSNY